MEKIFMDKGRLCYIVGLNDFKKTAPFFIGDVLLLSVPASLVCSDLK